MASTGLVSNSVTRVSSNSDLPANRDGPLISNEVSPLLQPKRTKAHQMAISERWRTAQSPFLDDNSGLLLVAAVQFFFSAMGIAIKWLNNLDDPVPTLELIFVRMVITYVCSVAYMYWKKIPDPLLGPKGLRALLVLRGLTGFFGLAGLYFSLQYLSLSDATVLTFIAPILIGFSGAVFLKEPLSLRETLAGPFLELYQSHGRSQVLFGSGEFSGPSEELVTPTQRMTSAALEGSCSLLIYLALLCGATLIGVLVATATFTVLLLASRCVLGSTLGTVSFKVLLVIPTHVLWLAMVFIVGILGLIGQTLLTMGLQRETAGRGTLAIYSSVVFVVILELIFSHATTPSALSTFRMLIIASSGIYVTLTKKIVTKPDAACERPEPSHDDDREA